MCVFVLLYTSLFTSLECELCVLLRYKCIVCLFGVCVTHLCLLFTYLLYEYVCLNYIQVYLLI